MLYNRRIKKRAKEETEVQYLMFLAKEMKWKILLEYEIKEMNI
jgi:hypothetical protein